MYWFKCKDISLLNKIIQSLYICKPQFTINLIFSFYSQLHRQISNMAVITLLTRHERSIWQVEHGTNVSPFVEGLRQFQISVYSCLHFSLITGSDFFKFSLSGHHLPNADGNSILYCSSKLSTTWWPSQPISPLTTDQAEIPITDR
jgi:hypothetical protein